MDKKEFWNNRAELKETAGTNDFMLKALELRVLKEKIDKGRILDVGCGNGRTLIELCKTKDISGVGIDFSNKTLEYARELLKETKSEDRISFICDDVLNLQEHGLGRFDYVITQRSLVNLNFPQQLQMFNYITEHLKPGGYYLMIEDFCDGLQNTNKLRVKLGLDKILPPWHNTFLDPRIVKNWDKKNFKLIDIVHFSSTYYYLSRVVNGKIARLHDREPQYDDEINKISLELPPIGNYCPTQLWVWKKQ